MKKLGEYTIEELELIHEVMGLDIVISDGGFIGFEKVEVGSSRCMYFSFSNRKH